MFDLIILVLVVYFSSRISRILRYHPSVWCVKLSWIPRGMDYTWGSPIHRTGELLKLNDELDLGKIDKNKGWERIYLEGRIVEPTQCQGICGKVLGVSKNDKSRRKLFEPQGGVDCRREDPRETVDVWVVRGGLSHSGTNRYKCRTLEDTAHWCQLSWFPTRKWVLDLSSLQERIIKLIVSVLT